MDRDASSDLLPGPGRLTRAFERLFPFALIAAAVVVLDQVTKAAIRGWLSAGEIWPGGAELIRLTHVENSGAAFGILQDAGIFLLVTSIIAVALIVAYLVWAPAEGWLATAALALVLGGALGNMIDRLARGSVTDFIDPTHYPAFNLADSAIVMGVAALVLMSVFAHGTSEETSDGSPS
jgi:signal peptidase II